jgi:hypothetical protein
MEQGHRGGVVQEKAGVLGWVEFKEQGWGVPELAQALAENACVQNVGRLLLMM